MNSREFVVNLMYSLDHDAIKEIADSTPYIEDAKTYMTKAVAEAIASLVSNNLAIIAADAEHKAIMAYLHHQMAELACENV